MKPSESFHELALSILPVKRMVIIRIVHSSLHESMRYDLIPKLKESLALSDSNDRLCIFDLFFTWKILVGDHWVQSVIVNLGINKNCKGPAKCQSLIISAIDLIKSIAS